jgi:F-type H+-transporting ATPase subunit b
MQELLHNLGIDGKLFLSQAANFLILLFVLHRFAYRPLLKLLHERRTKIEEGLERAEEADRRLGEANEMMKEKLREAEGEALRMMKHAEEKAKKKEAEMLAAAREKETAMLADTDKIIAAKAEVARKKMEAEAAVLVREALIKTVEMKPGAIDEALVGRALRETGKSLQ